MTVMDALRGVARLFLDTAPVIYFVEQNVTYAQRVNDIFDEIDKGSPIAVSSAITLAETLVVPYRNALVRLQQDFFDLLVLGGNSVFVSPGPREAQLAAEIRARYNLAMTDAIQVACALSAGCEALLTNDNNFRRVTELRVIILDDLT